MVFWGRLELKAVQLLEEPDGEELEGTLEQLSEEEREQVRSARDQLLGFRALRRSRHLRRPQKEGRKKGGSPKAHH